MLRTVPTTGLTLVLCLILCLVSIAAVQSQTPCTRSDNLGGTVLRVDIYESDNPNSISLDYRDLIPINGDVGQSNYFVTLTQQSVGINPSSYFSVVNSENTQFATGTSSGTYLRLINALSRDGGVDGAPAAQDSFTFGLTCSWNGATTQYTLQVHLNDVNDNNPLIRKLVFGAYDSAVRSQVATATVTINVVRNLHEPIFEIESYELDLPESTDIGTQVYRVAANDADGDVIRYSMLNVMKNAIAIEHFFLQPDNGQIWLVKSLLGFSLTQISIYIRASDQRNPERVDDSVVVINIIRDQIPPDSASLPAETMN